MRSHCNMRGSRSVDRNLNPVHFSLQFCKSIYSETQNSEQTKYKFCKKTKNTYRKSAWFLRPHISTAGSLVTGSLLMWSPHQVSLSPCVANNNHHNRECNMGHWYAWSVAVCWSEGGQRMTAPLHHHHPGSTLPRPAPHTTTRAANGGSRRFHNHWEGPY